MASSKEKCLALVLLVMQTSLMVLLGRYTRTVQVDKNRYLTSTVVFLSEIVKLCSCAIIIFYTNRFDFRKFLRDVYSATIGNPIDFVKIAVPSGTYAVQNNLLFVALTHLDAPTYQVTYQLKILSTALFAVVLLRKNLSVQQWAALVFLMIGVALVQFPTSSTNQLDEKRGSQLFGLFVIVVASITSGFAGVYFELLLKQNTFSLWIRNLQMAIFGIIFAGVQMWWKDTEKISSNGMLQGYTIPVYIVLLLQSYGGLLVACVIQYTDNIIKGFATSISIVLSSIFSYVVLDDLKLSTTFVVGTVLVLASTFMYGHRQKRVKSK